MRFPNSPQRDSAPMIPDDPFFLTGNYRLTLFTHASGLYQILTGERAWGRMNQGDDRWGGANFATVEISGQRHDLIGLDAPAAIAATRRFGIGFARYDYALAPSLSVTRLLSVAPSTTIGEGTSAFLTQITLRNSGSAPLQLHYSELTRAKYQQLFAAWDDSQQRRDLAHPGRRLSGQRNRHRILHRARQTQAHLPARRRNVPLRAVPAHALRQSHQSAA